MVRLSEETSKSCTAHGSSLKQKKEIQKIKKKQKMTPENIRTRSDSE